MGKEKNNNNDNNNKIMEILMVIIKEKSIKVLYLIKRIF